MTRFTVNSTRQRPPAPTLSLRISHTDLKAFQNESKSILPDTCVRLGITKVYGVTSGNFDAVREDWVDIREALEASSITFGAILQADALIPVETSSLCFSQADAQEKLEEAVRSIVSQVDELILVRFLPGDCQCDECRKGKGRHSWADYRRSLMLQVAKMRVAEPARTVNPAIKLGLAHPLPSCQMTVMPHFQIFDRVFLGGDGPEQRQSEPMEIPSEEGEAAGIDPALFFQWFSEIGGRKIYGALPPLMNPILSWTVKMTLAGASELVLGWETLPREVDALRELSESLSYLPQLAQVARKTPARGAALYLPQGCKLVEGEIETNLLRDVGIPLRPTPRFPLSSRSALFLSHALWDTQVSEKLGDYLDRGGRAALTEDFQTHLADVSGPADEESPNILLLNSDAFESMERVQQWRNGLLEPLGVALEAPEGVRLYLFGTKDAVLLNGRKAIASSRLNLSGKPLRIMASSGGWAEAGTELSEGCLDLPPDSWVWIGVT